MAIKLPCIQIEDDLARRLMRWKLGLNPETGKPLCASDLQFVPYEAFDGLRDPSPNQVLLVDLYATCAMESGVGAGAAWALAQHLRKPGEGERLNRLLQAIPPQATPKSEGSAQPAKELLQVLLDLKNFGPAVSCKLLCRKRPNLFPMWDSRIWDYVYYVRRERNEPWKRSGLRLADYLWNGFEWLDEIVKENRQVLEPLARSLTEDVAAIQPPPIPISPLRVLESLLWLAMSFPRTDWTFKNGETRSWWRSDMWPPTYWAPSGLTFEDFGPDWRGFCGRWFTRCDTSHKPYSKNERD